ncbi:MULTISPECIES: tRNA pseudouridine(55) synthase TruB [unclassified Sphingobacterium]|uniref:tRNA pseudouridine(55) synthase TruB n=1 Tax=unclassified Sphingobacterium TaxID=2609468 RepID=UPI002954F52E|nr:tRNA pseudouridine(55) synthase TruB [Sphingobacterium sp. UGAL515B_05]WON92977.1 tRNA pseudouridine(55) synthase TruB [Sphingobacterium sp. UGAL515B_05]
MENIEVSENPAKFNFVEGEMLLIDKPLTWTSFDVVGKVRNSIKPLKLKVGHAGTLDPLATGLLIVCTGKLTKKIDSYQAEDKEYTGSITLGATTPSYDLETEIDQTFSIDHITEEMIFEAAKSFEGDIQQFPPAHSAIKINGERVYEKARRGEEVEIKSRQVRINSFLIEKIELPNVYFRISCSKGTYIRSLAYDFGKFLQSGSHLSSLRRTKSGDYSVENAWNLEQLIAEIKRHKEIIK